MAQAPLVGLAIVVLYHTLGNCIEYESERRIEGVDRKLRVRRLFVEPIYRRDPPLLEPAR